MGTGAQGSRGIDRRPVSVALYGYRDHLFIGLNADQALMPEPDRFPHMIRAAFEELRVAVGIEPPRRARPPRKSLKPPRVQRRAARRRNVG